MFICSWPSLHVQFGHTDGRDNVSVCDTVTVRHCTRSDGICQLWRKKY